MDTAEQYGQMIEGQMKPGESLGEIRPQQTFYRAVITILCDLREQDQPVSVAAERLAAAEAQLAAELPGVPKPLMTIYIATVYAAIEMLAQRALAPDPRTITQTMEALGTTLRSGK